MGKLDARAEIMRLMREDFDPTPPNWEGRDWDDNAEDVADKIIAAALPTTPSNVSEALSVLRRWLAAYAEEEAAFSRYPDEVWLDGVMPAAEMRALGALLLGPPAPRCPYCGTTEGLRQTSPPEHPAGPDYICEGCFTGSDEGPCFDDLPAA